MARLRGLVQRSQVRSQRFWLRASKALGAVEGRSSRLAFGAPTPLCYLKLCGRLVAPQISRYLKSLQYFTSDIHYYLKLCQAARPAGCSCRKGRFVTAVDRTAYPRFTATVSERQLAEAFTPTDDE